MTLSLKGFLQLMVYGYGSGGFGLVCSVCASLLKAFLRGASFGFGGLVDVVSGFEYIVFPLVGNSQFIVFGIKNSGFGVLGLRLL